MKSGGRLVLWLLVLVLGWATVWLAMERNARRWTVKQEGDFLVVSKGRHFLLGESPIAADASALGKLYGPIQLPAGVTVAAAEFDDRMALDQAIFAALEPGKTLSAATLDRLTQLPGLTAAQLDRLAARRGDLAFSEAQVDLREATRLVHEAWQKLRVVESGKDERALGASAMAATLANVVPVLDELVKAPAPASADSVSPVPPAN
ncbi:MAG: hypothetical protein ABI609_17280 [Acidobacteriota bacterium]